jgi:hypothetical protein
VATDIHNKVTEVRAWIGQKMFYPKYGEASGVTFGDIETYINARWPDLDGEIKNRIYRASL